MRLRLEKRQHECMTEFRVFPASSSSPGIWIWALAFGPVAAFVAAQQAASLVVSVAAVIVILLAVTAAYQVTSESLVVLQGVGLLLTSHYRWGGASRQFLDIADIHSTFIQESLTTTNIHVHLAFLVHGRDQLAVAFPSLSPGLPVLTELYKELQQLVPGLA